MTKRKKTSTNAANSPPGRLRIVAGKWRGRPLPVADVPGLRPTSERIRETLFNWLQPTIEGARCLDLYAGTGALGFEALSRGAGEVVFVELSPVAVAALRKAEYVLHADDSMIHADDAIHFLESHDEAPFDIVFLDPPFDNAPLTDLCRLLEAEVADGALIYIERGSDQPAPDLPEGWEVLREKRAGMVVYSLVRASKPAAEENEGETE